MGKTRKAITETVIDNARPGIAWRGWLVTAAGVAGLVICLYLYTFHIALLMGEIKGGLLCGAGNGMGCNSVSASPYASFLGLPLAIWGAVFYAVLALLGIGGLVFRRDSGDVYLRWAFFLTVAALAVDLYLAHAMLFKIKALCGLCITTYAINLITILALVKPACRPSVAGHFRGSILPSRGEKPTGEVYYRSVIQGLLIGGILLTAVIGIAGSQFITRSLTGNERERLARVTESLSRQKPHRVDAADRPYLGSKDAGVTVV